MSNIIENENQEIRLEDLFSELERILGMLENRNLPLEDAFSHYQRGMNLLKQCDEKITRIEQQVQVLEGGQVHGFCQ